MKYTSEPLIKALEMVLGSFFGDMYQDLLGIVPKVDKSKKITFTTKPSGLVSLFFKGLNDTKITTNEKDTLSVLLRIASGYVDALQSRTQSNILSSINSHINKDPEKPIKAKQIGNIVSKEMGKAKKHFELIANAESNKMINTGTALQISRIGQSKDETDPTVFFIVTKDDVTGPYEYILHLLPDKVTPRLWKLSEIQTDYYKAGGQYPSLSGLHPNCRCKLTYLAKGYGFNDQGKVKFIGLDHDDLHAQRKKYGLPNVPDKVRKKKGEWVLPDMSKSEDSDNPKVSHIANNGQKVWKNKYIKWGKQGNLRTPEEMDGYHRHTWKEYSKQIPKGSALRNTLVNLNKEVINDNDRHLRISGVHNHPDGKKHTELRQRHLIRAFQGDNGYSVSEVKHPETGEHQGVRIKAPRHHKDGNVGETSWTYDGNSLKTESNKIFPKKY